MHHVHHLEDRLGLSGPAVVQPRRVMVLSYVMLLLTREMIGGSWKRGCGEKSGRGRERWGEGKEDRQTRSKQRIRKRVMKQLYNCSKSLSSINYWVNLSIN